MKKITVSVIFFTLCLFLHAQNWKIINYNDIVTFEFPENFIFQDTLGSKIYYANDSTSSYQSIITDGTGFSNSQTVEELESNYNKYLKGMASTMPDYKLIHKDFIDFGKLRALRTSFQSVNEDANLDVQNLSIYIDDKMFHFSVSTPGNQKVNFDRLIKTINFNSNFTLNNQINPRSSSITEPETLGKIGGLVILAAALFFGFRYSNRKKKQ